jgi:hypothetical protein
MTFYLLGAETKNSAGEKLQGFSIIGKTEIKDKSFQSFIKRTLIRSLSAKEVKCFQPEQGLRIADGKKKLDIIISLKCPGFRAYFKGQEKESALTEDAKILFSGALKDLDIAPRD